MIFRPIVGFDAADIAALNILREEVVILGNNL